jgi:proteasome accessory factor B
VRPDDYYLPDLGLTPDETAALRVAVSAVSLGDGAGEGALMKLGGTPSEPVAPIASLPIAPALAPLFEAFRKRAVVEFTHRGRVRRVEPWGLASKRGHWYLVGFDREREAIRAFRADRIDDDVTAGPAGEFDVPSDFRPDEHVENRPWLLGEEPPTTVRVAIDNDQRDALLTDLAGDARTVEAGAGDTTIVELVVTNRAAFRAYVLGYLEHAEVLDPPDLRAEIIAWLEPIAR